MTLIKPRLMLLTKILLYRQVDDEGWILFNYLFASLGCRSSSVAIFFSDYNDCLRQDQIINDIKQRIPNFIQPANLMQLPSTV